MVSVAASLSTLALHMKKWILHFESNSGVTNTKSRFLRPRKLPGQAQGGK